jgi:hypothetical protein
MAGEARLYAPHPTPRWDPAERAWLVEQGLLDDGLVRQREVDYNATQLARVVRSGGLGPPRADRP